MKKILSGLFILMFLAGVCFADTTVKAHTRTSKTGKVYTVKEHTRKTKDSSPSKDRKALEPAKGKDTSGTTVKSHTRTSKTGETSTVKEHTRKTKDSKNATSKTSVAKKK